MFVRIFPTWFTHILFVHVQEDKAWQMCKISLLPVFPNSLQEILCIINFEWFINNKIVGLNIFYSEEKD